MAKDAARKPLSTDRVVTAALRLVDRRGLEDLSMRRLGEALQVEAMSLYKHVPNKGALLDLLVERVLGDMKAPDRGAAWDERLRHVAAELRRVSLAHPHVFPLLATRVPATAAGFAPLEALLAALLDAGLADDAAVEHFWAALAYVTGALLSETAAASGRGTPSLAVPEGLDEASFPSLRRLAPRLASCDFEAEFSRGLDILVAAVATAGAAVARTPATKPTVLASPKPSKPSAASKNGAAARAGRSAVRRGRT